MEAEVASAAVTAPRFEDRWRSGLFEQSTVQGREYTTNGQDARATPAAFADAPAVFTNALAVFANGLAAFTNVSAASPAGPPASSSCLRGFVVDLPLALSPTLPLSLSILRALRALRGSPSSPLRADNDLQP